MLDSGKRSLENLSKEFPNLRMKGKEHSETLDNLIKQTFINDPFLSVNKADKSPVERFHWLDTFDINQNSDSRGMRQEEHGSKISENVVSKNNSQSNLRASGEKFNSLEAMIAIAQANKDLPGWPLMSNKMTVYKCDKCSQEFWSPMNQRRHMRAKHRRPLNGDKEDLKKKRGQIAAYWDKLPKETACEIVSSNNLRLMDLTATSIIDALSTQLERPGLLSLPQSCIKAATSIMDVVQRKCSQFRFDSNDLFAILDDASEKTTFHGVTSSSMQRYIFENEPGKVGIEVKNLVASLGFLIELRLVNAWTDDKEAEALRCLKALVEEEEAAEKKRAKLQERKRQKKMRHKESKDKERKGCESLSGVEKFDTSSMEDGGSGSPSSSCYSGTDANPIEEKHDAKNFEFSSSLNSRKEGMQHVDGHNESATTGNFQEQMDPRNAIMQQVAGVGWGWVDRKAEASHFSASSKQAYNKEKRYSDHHYAGQRYFKKMHGIFDDSFHEFPHFFTSKNNFFREQSSGIKKSTNTSGNGHAVWAKKVSQCPGEYDGNVKSERAVTINSVESKMDLCSDSDKLGVAVINNSSLSAESVTSSSLGSVFIREGAENQQDADENTVDAIKGRVNGALVIGSVIIPFGNQWQNDPLCAEWDRGSQVYDNFVMDSEKHTEYLDSSISHNLPRTFSSNSADGSSVSKISVSHELISGDGIPEALETQWPNSDKFESMTVQQPVMIQQSSCLSHDIAFGTEILVGLDATAFETEILFGQDLIEAASRMDYRSSDSKFEEGSKPLVSSLQADTHDLSVAIQRDNEEHDKKTIVVSEPMLSANMQVTSSSLDVGLSMPLFSYSDIANLLYQRWVEATSSSDVVFHHDSNMV